MADGSLLQLVRIDPHVRPTMYRCATVSLAELEQLRTVKNIVRLGRVRSIRSTEIVLENGSIATTPNTLHIDCTADGLGRRPTGRCSRASGSRCRTSADASRRSAPR